MNNTTLIGRLANEPELSYTAQGTAVCKFTLAVSRMKKDDPADFIRITAWGKQGENCDKYLSKGRRAAVKGRIQTGSYTDKDGKKVYTTEVVAENVEFLDSPSQQRLDVPPEGMDRTVGEDEFPDAFQGFTGDDMPPF